eukprot:15473883-Alexandrium_andersonii.AAC.1
MHHTRIVTAPSSTHGHRVRSSWPLRLGQGSPRPAPRATGTRVSAARLGATSWAGHSLTLVASPVARAGFPRRPERPEPCRRFHRRGKHCFTHARRLPAQHAWTQSSSSHWPQRRDWTL